MRSQWSHWPHLVPRLLLWPNGCMDLTPRSTESDWSILRRTWRNYKRVAQSPAVPGAPQTRRGTTI